MVKTGFIVNKKFIIMNNGEKGFLAFLAGLATGAAIGVLFAPRSGEETRKIIGDKAEEYSEEAQKQINEMVETGKGEILKAKKKAMDAVEKALKDLKDAEDALADEVKGKSSK